MPSRPTIVITSGEPAGIGPDLCVLLASEWASDTRHKTVILGDARLLASRAAALGRAADWPPTGNLSIQHMPLAAPCVPGQLDVRNAPYVLALLDSAIDGCTDGRFAAMVTAPVQKSVIAESGVPFTGHTEYLAERTNAPFVVMLLVGGTPPMRVALTTIHMPLKDVPTAITRHRLIDTLHVLNNDLRDKFGIAKPRILVAGLNPHAGESGHLGREEIDTIAPVIEALRHEGLLLEGPLPADTLFTPSQLSRADAVLAMYHDQGLPVLKHASFGQGVNITLGLPIIRTSVDHGTALDLAGKGNIDPGSLRAAVDLARQLSATNASDPVASQAHNPPMLPRAKKQFGQHFLTDQHVIDRIVAAIAPKPDDVMIEIGPGPGALTQPLLIHLSMLHAVEIDRDLAAALRKRFEPSRLLLHEIDVLSFDFASLSGRFRCVGNLPYNISTPFLFHLERFAGDLIDATFMLQKEVVDRMVAEPGTPDYGRLSVMLQYRFAMQRLFIVPPEAFTPPPKVESAIVRMIPLGPDRLRARDEARFAAMVMGGFGQRRKTLSNTLRPFLTAAQIGACDIDPQRRAETLSVAEFLRLADYRDQ